jgi:hypothetical protein
MELSKTQSLELIHRKLSKLADSIALLDAALAKEASIKADIVKLRQIEVEIIAKDESKPDALLQQRAKIDLAAGKLERQHKTVLIAEEQVVLDPEVTAQVTDAYKQRAIAEYWKVFQDVVGPFFDPQDIPRARHIAERQSNAQALTNWAEFSFTPKNPSFRVHDLHNARRFHISFADLERSVRISSSALIFRPLGPTKAFAA